MIHFLKLLLNDSQKIIGIIGKFYFIKKSTSVDQLECIFFILLGDYILLLIIDIIYLLYLDKTIS